MSRPASAGELRKGLGDVRAELKQGLSDVRVELRQLDKRLIGVAKETARNSGKLDAIVDRIERAFSAGYSRLYRLVEGEQGKVQKVERDQLIAADRINLLERRVKRLEDERPVS